jgi:hypothetical protein
VKKWLILLCNSSALVSVITARGLMLATIMWMQPEILEKTFKDSSTFRTLDTFMHGWLHSTMHWSKQKVTQAAQKMPKDWEDQCEQSTFQKVYVIKENNILSGLFVNLDQTGVVLAPRDKMTWAKEGAKQVSLVGGKEKRAFTVTSMATLYTMEPLNRHI